jgi:hypothetical protein
VVVILHFAAELARGVVDDVPLLKIAPALDPVLNEEPDEELDSWRGSVPPDEVGEVAAGGLFIYCYVFVLGISLHRTLLGALTCL